MSAVYCVCGSEIDHTSTIDHDGRCDQCPEFCSPDSCSCESEFVTQFEGAHGYLAEQCVRALVALGEARDAAERDVARSVSEGTDHIEWLLSDITLNPEYYHSGDAVVSTCSCGRCYTEESFRALPSPIAGDVMPDMEGGVLVLRNCQCGSTRAIKGNTEDMLRLPHSSDVEGDTGLWTEMLSTDPEYLEWLGVHESDALDHQEEACRVLSQHRAASAA